MGRPTVRERPWLPGSLRSSACADRWRRARRDRGPDHRPGPDRPEHVRVRRPVAGQLRGPRSLVRIGRRAARRAPTAQRGRLVHGRSRSVLCARRPCRSAYVFGRRRGSRRCRQRRPRGLVRCAVLDDRLADLRAGFDLPDRPRPDPDLGSPHRHRGDRASRRDRRRLSDPTWTTADLPHDRQPLWVRPGHPTHLRKAAVRRRSPPCQR